MKKYHAGRRVPSDANIHSAGPAVYSDCGDVKQIRKQVEPFGTILP